MKVIELDTGLGEAVLLASGTLRQGGVIIYPTDTLYGLGADALSDTAVDRVYQIKGRHEGKPMHAVFADMAMVEEYAELNDLARTLAAKFLPGALTLILKKKPGLDSGIVKGIPTIGIRIPENEFCLELARTYGKPFTATSANRSGQVPKTSIAAIEAQLGLTAELVDLAIDAAVFPMRAPTTVVNVTSGYPVILREGAIPKEEIITNVT